MMITKMHEFNVWEAGGLEAFQEAVRQPWLDKIMTFYTSLNDGGKLAIIVCALLLLIPKSRKTGVCASVSLVINAVVVNIYMKPMFARPRPYSVNQFIELLAGRQGDLSFPSGHTSSMFAVAGAILACMNKKLGAIALLLAGIMGFSRIYVGVHYFTDVIGGALVGLGCSYLSVALLKQIKKD
ncbi:MAG: phosphatase PAP2 family protein [Lachnospiraceae bacterium]|nr:phosphatase PAP2 family protein [Lachnospiraceae bacterium]